MPRPRILLTPWRRELTTALGVTDLLTIAPAYPDAVARAGGLPVVAPHLDEPALDELLDTVDGVVVTGGHDMDPGRYGQVNAGSRSWRADSDSFDLAVVRRATTRGLPVLGICRGLQVINVALGGDLRQEVQRAGDPDHPTYAEMADPVAHRHVVRIEADTRLAAIQGAGAQSVNSLHHQAAGTVGRGLRVVATTSDGTIEALEGTEPGLDVVAVQWHPEMVPDEGGDALFADLVARARRRATMVP